MEARMNKYIAPLIACSFLYGCANQPAAPLSAAAAPSADNSVTATPVAPMTPQACVGSTALPASVAQQFTAVEDAALLTKAVGEPNKGALCQGQVYQTKPGAKLVLFRAWNSTNPGSKLGKWWAFNQPQGKVADYRKDYEICYQWSPLDMLVSCTLKPGEKVVIGNGQSAQCSQYLTYPVSAAQQIYIDQAETALSDCKTLNGTFAWQ